MSGNRTPDLTKQLSFIQPGVNSVILLNNNSILYSARTNGGGARCAATPALLNINIINAEAFIRMRTVLLIATSMRTSVYWIALVYRSK